MEEKVKEPDKILDFFKQKLSIATTDDLLSKYVDKITLIQSCIIIPEAFTENIAEQFDAVLDEFSINIKSSSIEDIKNITAVLKSFALSISEEKEDHLLQKLELITAMSKWHGFASISKVSEEKLSDLKALYSTLAGSELSDISYDVFNKVRKINLAPVKQFAKLSDEELSQFLEFCKSYEINTNLEIADLIKTSELNEILKILKIENSWLTERNQKKLTTLFLASNVTKLTEIKFDYVKAVSTIGKEFNFDFSKLSALKLKSVIKQLSSLKITFNSKAEEIENIAGFVRQFCKTEELSIYDAVGIAKIAEVLGINKRDKKETRDITQLMKSHGIKFSLSEDLEIELEKIQKLSAILNGFLSRNIDQLSYLQIKEVSNLVKTFTEVEIISVSVNVLEPIKKIFRLFSTQHQTKEFDAKKLQEILVVLEVELKEVNKIENLSSNLKKLKLDIWSLDKIEIQKIQELFGHLDSSITTEVITSGKIEKFLKIKECLGVNYQIKDIEKINKLAGVVGRDKLSNLEIEDISKIKLITDELGIDIRTIHISEIEQVIGILFAYDIKSAESKQSTLSKIWSGSSQAIKDKLGQIKEIFKKFGYDSLSEVKGQEKVKFENLLELYQKSSFQDINVEVSKNINKFLSSLGLNFKGLSSYKLKSITEGLEQIGINLFDSGSHLENYGYFLKEINLDIEKLDKRTGNKISETLGAFGVNRANIKEEVNMINDAIESLHLPKFLEIKKEQLEKIKELGEAITGEKVELTPKVVCNIGKVMHRYKEIFESPLNMDIKPHEPDEKELVDKIKELQVFNIDLSSNADVAGKNNLIMNLMHLYKSTCHKDKDGQDGYGKELSAMMSLDKKKLVDFINHAGSKGECFKIKDVAMGKECEIFLREIEMEITGLCPVIHEDL